MANLSPAQHAGSRTAINFPAYLSGYFDGEGLLNGIHLTTSDARGWVGSPSKRVCKPERGPEPGASYGLVLLRVWFNPLRPGDKTVKWEVRSLHLIRECVIPHFEEWPILSAKQADFKGLAAVCELTADGEQLEKAGLVEIVRISAEMSPSGKRRFDPWKIISELAR